METFQLFVVIASGGARRLKRQLLPIETKTRGTAATVAAKEQLERQLKENKDLEAMWSVMKVKSTSNKLSELKSFENSRQLHVSTGMATKSH